MTMSLDRLKMAKQKTIGTKQTAKAVEKGQVSAVYIARDADEHVVRDLLRTCQLKQIEVVYVDSMAALGKACGIEVGAATAAVLEI